MSAGRSLLLDELALILYYLSQCWWRKFRHPLHLVLVLLGAREDQLNAWWPRRAGFCPGSAAAGHVV